MRRRVAGIELRLAAIDDRLDDVNRWLLDTLTLSAQAQAADPSVPHELAGLVSRLEHSAASPSAGETPAEPSGGQEGADLPSLAAWVNWVATAFDLSERWPSCWYRHEGLAFEMQSLRRWHVALSAQLASDPTSATRWSEALHRVGAQSARRIAQRCLSTHRDAPSLDQIPDGTARTE